MCSTMRPALLALIVCGTTACASMSGAPRYPLAPRWIRESFGALRVNCSRSECRATAAAAHSPITVRTRTREYTPDELPGWDSGSPAGRVAGSIGSEIMRHAGLTTDRTQIGLGSRVASDSGDGVWQLRCSVFWIDADEVEYNRKEADHVTRHSRTTEGIDCGAGAMSDSGVARWRYRAGIAPRRDSVAIVYDSLVALKSAAVSASPPMSLERLPAGLVPGAGYRLSRDARALTLAEPMVGGGGRINITRENGDAVAIIHTGLHVTLDVSPDATAEEVRVFRLIAATMVVPLISSR